MLGARATLVASDEATTDLLEFERALVRRGDIVAGIDEVGRGALAGPLMVGRSYFENARRPRRASTTPSYSLQRSARRSSSRCDSGRPRGRSGLVSAAEIDAWGLRRALAVAATRALEALSARADPRAGRWLAQSPHVAPVDVVLGAEAPPPTAFLPPAGDDRREGRPRAPRSPPRPCSAKVRRDAVMVALDEEFGAYGWAS